MERIGFSIPKFIIYAVPKVCYDKENLLSNEKTGVIYIEKDFIYRNRRHNRFEEDGKWFDSADYAGGVIVLYSGGGRPL